MKKEHFEGMRPQTELDAEHLTKEQIERALARRLGRATLRLEVQEVEVDKGEKQGRLF